MGLDVEDGGLGAGLGEEVGDAHPPGVEDVLVAPSLAGRNDFSVTTLNIPEGSRQIQWLRYDYTARLSRMARSTCSISSGVRLPIRPPSRVLIADVIGND